MRNEIEMTCPMNLLKAHSAGTAARMRKRKRKRKRKKKRKRKRKRKRKKNSSVLLLTGTGGPDHGRWGTVVPRYVQRVCRRQEGCCWPS